MQVLTPFFSMRSALSASRSASILDLRAAAFLALSVCTRSPLPTSDKACGNTEYLLGMLAHHVLHVSNKSYNTFTQLLLKIWLSTDVGSSQKDTHTHTHTAAVLMESQNTQRAYPENGLLGGVSPHLLLNGLLLTLSLCLGQEGTIEHGPSVLDQHLQ